jgi:hypothetical protein
MSVPPRDPAVLEPERYELAGEAPYRFELQRRELFKLIGGGPSSA